MISGAFEHSVCVCWKFMVCTGHRLQCKTLHFTKHKFPIIMHVRNTKCSNAPEINCMNSQKILVVIVVIVVVVYRSLIRC